jgi:transposase
MARNHFIALDTHCGFSELAAVTQQGKLVRRDRCATNIPDLREAIEQVRRPRFLTFEEGPLADWLARNLAPCVDQLLVCEPRRNRLISRDGDKDDPLDALRLAQLFRGGYLKEVHQTPTLERSLLKQQVCLYHDRVRERVRQGHQLVAQFRRHGVFASVATFEDALKRRELWRQLPASEYLRRNLDRLWKIYEMHAQQEDEIRSELITLARRQEVVRRFTELPGVAWIRALTFYVFVDTPCRFDRKSTLWRYCGIGLLRRHSGQGETQTRLDHRGNRRLKDVLLGAAQSAIQQDDNPFATKYRYWTQEEGMHRSVARRNVARCLAATLWGLWKSGKRYDPAAVRGVGRPAAAKTTR